MKIFLSTILILIIQQNVQQTEAKSNGKGGKAVKRVVAKGLGSAKNLGPKINDYETANATKPNNRKAGIKEALELNLVNPKDSESLYNYVVTLKASLKLYLSFSFFKS